MAAVARGRTISSARIPPFFATKRFDIHSTPSFWCGYRICDASGSLRRIASVVVQAEGGHSSAHTSSFTASASCCLGRRAGELADMSDSDADALELGDDTSDPDHDSSELDATSDWNPGKARARKGLLLRTDRKIQGSWRGRTSSSSVSDCESATELDEPESDASSDRSSAWWCQEHLNLQHCPACSPTAREHTQRQGWPAVRPLACTSAAAQGGARPARDSGDASCQTD